MTFSKKERLKHFFIGGAHFKAEFRRQVRLFIIVTLGFTIAFTWRQTVFDTTQWIVRAITHIENSAAASILTSTAITLISLLFIWVTSHFLQERPTESWSSPRRKNF